MASVLNSQNETESRHSDFPKFKNNEEQPMSQPICRTGFPQKLLGQPTQF